MEHVQENMFSAIITVRRELLFFSVKSSRALLAFTILNGISMLIRIFNNMEMRIKVENVHSNSKVTKTVYNILIQYYLMFISYVNNISINKHYGVEFKDFYLNIKNVFTRLVYSIFHRSNFYSASQNYCSWKEH